MNTHGRRLNTIRSTLDAVDDRRFNSHLGKPASTQVQYTRPLNFGYDTVERVGLRIEDNDRYTKIAVSTTRLNSVPRLDVTRLVCKFC